MTFIKIISSETKGVLNINRGIHHLELDWAVKWSAVSTSLTASSPHTSNWIPLLESSQRGLSFAGAKPAARLLRDRSKLISVQSPCV